MTKPKVVVTRRWPQAVEAALASEFDVRFNASDTPMSQADLRDAMLQADAVLPTVTDRISADIFDNGTPRARMLANYGVGFNHIDIDAARERGIAVTNTPDVLSACTADLALTLMLMVARRAHEGESELRSGGWNGWSPTHMMGARVSAKTLGLIGFGRIGREVAKRAHFGFGMRVLVHDRTPLDADMLNAAGAERAESLEALLAQSDFVSLHCPGGRENHHLIDANRLNQMKPTAFLVNTARGEIVDEQALFHALWFETIGGAGLDVYSDEPNVSERLKDCRNAVLLPHLGSATRETREAMGMRVIENLRDFFDGRAPRDLVA